MGLRVLLVLSVTAVVYVGWTVISLWLSFRSIDRVDLDLDETLEAIANLPEADRPPPPPEELDAGPPANPVPVTNTPAPVTETPQLPYDPQFAAGPVIPDKAFNAFLIVGTDARAGLAGSRADVIILALLPEDGSAPILVSLPRDLYVAIPCWESPRRINVALAGCGSAASGPELLAVTVANFTGIRLDHFALFDFEDFKRVIDAFGGIRICVDNPVRDGLLDLPAGCTNADGAMALAWVRSRKTQELVDGEWRRMRGVNDLTRNTRQRELLVQLLGKVKSFGTLTSLTNIVASIADAVTIDEGLSITNAIGLAWDLRGVSPGAIGRVTIPVRDFRTDSGAQVLLPTKAFAEVFELFWP